MPGRPAKPLVLHQIHGTAQKCRVEKRKGELQLKPGSVGVCPGWISPEGREEWRRLVRDPDYSRVLAPAHRGALIDYCFLYGRMVRSRRGLPLWVDGKEAQPIPGHDGIEPAEVEHLAASELQMLHSLRMQLGLTPASGSKVQVPQAPDVDDPWANIGNRSQQNRA